MWKTTKPNTWKDAIAAYDGGHGVGATREQLQRRIADRWSFFLWQAGMPAFQPVP